MSGTVEVSMSKYREGLTKGRDYLTEYSNNEPARVILSIPETGMNPNEALVRINTLTNQQMAWNVLKKEAEVSQARAEAHTAGMNAQGAELQAAAAAENMQTEYYNFESASIRRETSGVNVEVARIGLEKAEIRLEVEQMTLPVIRTQAMWEIERVRNSFYNTALDYTKEATDREIKQQILLANGYDVTKIPMPDLSKLEVPKLDQVSLPKSDS